MIVSLFASIGDRLEPTIRVEHVRDVTAADDTVRTLYLMT